MSSSQKLLSHSFLNETKIVKPSASLRDLFDFSIYNGREKVVKKRAEPKAQARKRREMLRNSSHFSLQVNRQKKPLSIFGISQKKSKGEFIKTKENRTKNKSLGQSMLLPKCESTPGLRFRSKGKQPKRNRFMAKSTMKKYFVHSNQKLLIIGHHNNLCLVNKTEKVGTRQRYPQVKVFESRKEENIQMSQIIAGKFQKKKRHKNLTKKQSDKLFKTIFIEPQIKKLFELKQTCQLPLAALVDERRHGPCSRAKKSANLFKRQKLSAIKFKAHLAPSAAKRGEQAEPCGARLFDVKESSGDWDEFNRQDSNQSRLVRSATKNKLKKQNGKGFKHIQSELKREHKRHAECQSSSSFAIKLKYWQLRQEKQGECRPEKNPLLWTTIQFQHMREEGHNQFQKFLRNREMRERGWAAK